MAVWAIGDLQGCHDATMRLLDAIRFDPAQDQLWFCGDLVNRGGQSLETLRLVHSLRAHSRVVLGNHDLSLVAIGERSDDEKRRVNPDLQRIVFADDARVLLDWLRQRPLAHFDPQLGWLMVHAGIAPNWSLDVALGYAREVEARLRGGAYRKLLRAMYGNRPMFNAKLVGMDRYRAIINVFTRMRYCTPRGRIAFEEKGAPGSQAVGLYPWFAVPGQVVRDVRIVCGHWSTLGLSICNGVHSIDTGAVWGGRLTALRLDGDAFELRQVAGRLPGPGQVFEVEE